MAVGHANLDVDTRSPPLKGPVFFTPPHVNTVPQTVTSPFVHLSLLA